MLFTTLPTTPSLSQQLPLHQPEYQVSIHRNCRFNCTKTEIIHATDAGLVSALVLLDLSSRLIRLSIENYWMCSQLDSVTNRIGEWFVSYLKDRTKVISTQAGIYEAVTLACDMRCIKRLRGRSTAIHCVQ